MTRPRLLVAGGRNFADRSWLRRVLTRFAIDNGDPEVLMHGDASGADRLAGEWASNSNVPVLRFPARWGDLFDVPPSNIRTNRAGKKYNVRAGFQRNAQMITEGNPTHAIVFPGGTGTDDCAYRLDTLTRQLMRDPVHLLDLRAGPLVDAHWKMTTARVAA